MQEHAYGHAKLVGRLAPALAAAVDAITAALAVATAELVASTPEGHGNVCGRRRSKQFMDARIVNAFQISSTIRVWILIDPTSPPRGGQRCSNEMSDPRVDVH